MIEIIYAVTGVSVVERRQNPLYQITLLRLCLACSCLKCFWTPQRRRCRKNFCLSVGALRRAGLFGEGGWARMWLLRLRAGILSKVDNSSELKCGEFEREWKTRRGGSCFLELQRWPSLETPSPSPLSFHISKAIKEPESSAHRVTYAAQG